MTCILVVDDSMTDAHTMRSALEGDGHEVVVAETAWRGLALAQEKQPDLILMDVVFEGMSGFQGTRKLAKHPKTAHIPIIIVSRKDQESDKVWGRRQGAVDYLVKPVNPQKLLSTVTLVMRGRSSARSS